MTVGSAAPDNAMHFRQAQGRVGIGTNCVAWVGAPDMGTYRASETHFVLQLVEEVISLACIGMATCAGRHQGLAARPAPEQSGGNPGLGRRADPATQMLGCVRDKIIEGLHVLLELAEYQVGPIAQKLSFCRFGSASLFR